MEIDKVIHYILIGNLMSGKVIFEMSNKIEPKTLYEANLIFTNLQKKRQNSKNTKINSFIVSIFFDGIIMIAKTDDLFPIERVFEIFSEIKKSIPNLSEISMDFNLNFYKQSLKEKITKIINGYFDEINSERRMLKTIGSFNYTKNDVIDIIKEESEESKNESSISSQNSQNKNSKNNSLISSKNEKNKKDNFPFDNIKLNKTVFVKERSSKIFKNDMNKTKKMSMKIIDDNEDDKTNMYRSLVKSSSLVKINNNNDMTTKRSSLREVHMTNKYVNELKNIVSNITVCKKVIIFFIILVIIIQIVAIPLIIKYSYSY